MTGADSRKAPGTFRPATAGATAPRLPGIRCNRSPKSERRGLPVRGSSVRMISRHEMEFPMGNSKYGPVVDPELDKALSELLAQTAKEPISPRLRELAQQLEIALQDARNRRGQGGGAA